MEDTKSYNKNRWATPSCKDCANSYTFGGHKRCEVLYCAYEGNLCWDSDLLHDIERGECRAFEAEEDYLKENRRLRNGRTYYD